MFDYGEAQKTGTTIDYGEKSGALELTMGWCTGVEHPGTQQSTQTTFERCRWFESETFHCGVVEFLDVQSLPGRALDSFFPSK